MLIGSPARTRELESALTRSDQASLNPNIPLTSHRDVAIESVYVYTLCTAICGHNRVQFSSAVEIQHIVKRHNSDFPSEINRFHFKPTSMLLLWKAETFLNGWGAGKLVIKSFLFVIFIRIHAESSSSDP